MGLSDFLRKHFADIVVITVAGVALFLGIRMNAKNTPMLQAAQIGVGTFLIAVAVGLPLRMWWNGELAEDSPLSRLLVPRLAGAGVSIGVLLIVAALEF